MKLTNFLLIFSLCLILTTNKLNAQSENNNVKYVYCELVGTSKFLSTKVNVTVDYGEHVNYFTSRKAITDEESGKIKTFNSMVDALNYMGDRGWEFVQAYVVTVGNQNVYHWLLKKSIE
jgi:hypothetical protein